MSYIENRSKVTLDVSALIETLNLLDPKGPLSKDFLTELSVKDLNYIRDIFRDRIWIASLAWSKSLGGCQLMGTSQRFYVIGTIGRKLCFYYVDDKDAVLICDLMSDLKTADHAFEIKA